MHYGDDMRCIIVLATKQVGHFEGICLSASRSIVCAPETNAMLKFLFSQLDDQQDYVYENCVVYCRKAETRVTISFEIEELDLTELD